MAEILKLINNTPEKIALRYTEGREVTGQYGTRLMFSLKDGRILYTPTLVAGLMKEAGIGQGEAFEICKKEVSGKVSYEVRKLDGPQLVKESAKTETLTKLGEVLVNGLPVNGEGSNLLRVALHTVIDEAAEAEKYAAEKGLNIRFDNCDLRAFVNTMMIGLQHAGGR